MKPNTFNMDFRKAKIEESLWNFNKRLDMAIEFAKLSPNPSKEERDQALRIIKDGLSVSQSRLAVMVYNNCLKRIDYIKKNG